MPDNLLIYVFIAIAAIIVVVVLLKTRGTKQNGEGSDKPAEEGHGVSDSLAAAVEDVVGEFTGVEVHPTTVAAAGDLRPDKLTQIKGLGPKAAATLSAIGITRFDQIAEWTADDIATVGAKLGNRTERIRRDQWVEQAGLLAEGNVEAFEAKFGKLG